MHNKPHTEEAKKKMREAHSRYWLGKKRPDISRANKGKILSEETKRKISRAGKGRKAWNKGKKYHLNYKETEEHRRKISESKKGSKAYQWKGGISKINKRIRAGIEFRLWREAVFARDNWICQKYGVKGGRLQPHHIKNFAQYPELRFAIDNGITFLEKAHKEFHKKYGYKNNTKEQLIEFLEN